jgi:hypothetical protein
MTAMSEAPACDSAADDSPSLQVAANDVRAADAPDGNLSPFPEEHDGAPSTADVSGAVSSARVSIESQPMVEGSDLGENGDEMKSKEANGEARDASSADGGSRTGSLRSTSSKIASLRATFEKHSPVDTAVKRRFPNAERKAESPISDREREYWKEIARLRDERDKEQELRQAYEEKCVALEAETERVQQLVDERSNRESQNTTLRTEPAACECVNATKTRSRDEQVNSLQQQLSDLKRSISTATRMDNQTTDSTLAQEIGVLHNELQNWIVNNFRRVKACVAPSELSSRLEGVAEPRQAGVLKQIYTPFDPSAKLAVYQATAVVLLMDVFTEALLFGMPSDQEWCKHIFWTAGDLERQLTPMAFNKWRAATLEAIQHSAGFDAMVQSAVARMTETISRALGKLTDTEPNVAALSGIVKRAVSLAHIFRLQRARYDFCLPSPTEAFDPSTMEDALDRSDGIADSTVRCATFPGVLKFGDEYGDNLHLRNVIVKAKVLCSDLDP